MGESANPPYDRIMMKRASAIPTKAIAAIQALMAQERGASIVEYVFLVVFIAIAAIAAVALVGESLNSEYDTISDSVTNYGR